MGTVFKTVNRFYHNHFNSQCRVFPNFQNGIPADHEKEINHLEAKPSTFGNTDRADAIFEKLIEQYEGRLEDKDTIIRLLKEKQTLLSESL
ncbi:hypothetical protein LS482_16080 [Sinomicrobium kalidii]|uniref:hypothetical protein n=1 Tax=Sinomicrobium kalidii TaxID=2900738 RepID=UPI001E48FE94|nr:hypothetical protein [Sinomicrobium kalidii]UGU15191.1 hypothetical protein LS482_16080 [Sinomicrobium kalidii]